MILCYFSLPKHRLMKHTDFVPKTHYGVRPAKSIKRSAQRNEEKVNLNVFHWPPAQQIYLISQ